MNSFSLQEQLCLTFCLKSSLLTWPRIPNRGGRKGVFLFAAINSTPEPLANIDPLRLRPLPLILQRTPRAKRREIKMEIQVGVVAQVNILTWLFHIFLKKIIVKIIHIKGRNFTEVIVTIAAG